MHIDKRWFSFLAVLCFSFSVSAQPAASAAGNRRSLWKVQGQSNSVYLLGSVHVLKKAHYPLAGPIEAAFSNSAIAAFETDIAALDDPSSAMKLLAKSQLPAGETLKSQLSPDVYKLWTSQLEKSGLPPIMFEQFAPGMAAITVAALEMQKLQLDPKYGVDKHFFALAKETGKEIVPLESVDFQINLITGFTKEEGEGLLKATLQDIKTLKSDLGELLKAWEFGDGAQLEKLLNDAMKDSPAIYKRMLTDRNRDWLPKIEALARGKKNAIVIVGAAHLVGKEGVVELLKAKGWKVTQE
jgi:uncharacterized protein